MNIVLHIERLVLEGIATELGSQKALREAVQTELVRLFGEAGLAHAWQHGDAVSRITGAPLLLPAAPRHLQPVRTAALGRQIAASIHSGLGRGRP